MDIQPMQDLLLASIDWHDPGKPRVKWRAEFGGHRLTIRIGYPGLEPRYAVLVDDSIEFLTEYWPPTWTQLPRGDSAGG